MGRGRSGLLRCLDEREPNYLSKSHVCQELFTDGCNGWKQDTSEALFNDTQVADVTAGRDGGLFISDRSPYSDRLSVKTSTESQTYSRRNVSKTMST